MTTWETPHSLQSRSLYDLETRAPKANMTDKSPTKAEGLQTLLANTPSRDNTPSREGEKQDESFVGNVVHSALYSGLQSPASGVIQLVDKTLGTEILPTVQFMEPPKPQPFGSKAWHAQQLGSGIGMIAPFLVASKFSQGAMGKMGLTAAAESSALVRTSAAISQGALAGFSFDFAMRPVNASEGDFWTARMKHGAVGAATFATLTAGSLGLRSVLGTAGAAVPRLKEVGIGAASAAPAGLLSAELDAQTFHGRHATSKELLESAYGMVFVGAGLGGLHQLAGRVTEGSKSNKTSGDSRASTAALLSAGDAGIPVVRQRTMGRMDTATERATERATEPASTSGKKWSGVDLNTHLQSVPENLRLTEFAKELASASPKAAVAAMPAIPASEYPKLVKVISEVSDPALRTSLLSDFPTLNLIVAPEAVRNEVLKSLFQESSRLEGNNTEMHQRWWNNLPETQQVTEGRMPTPVKDFLANELPPAQLAEILFGSQGVSSALGRRLAATYPEAVKEIARNVQDTGPDGAMPAVKAAAIEFLRTKSIVSSVEKASSEPQSSDFREAYAVPEMLGKLSRYADKTAPNTVHDLIDLASTSAKQGRDVTASSALVTAVQVVKANGGNLKTEFVDPIVELVRNEQIPYETRLLLASELGRLERTGDVPADMVSMPDLRMRPIADLTEGEQRTLRETTEAALYQPAQLLKMMGEGRLGQLFPTIFGKYSEGGIVGRAQHNGHEFELHKHILEVVEKTSKHPEFKNLSEKDQVNLLWASLLHDVSKRAGIVDVGHEWRSSQISWGVLKSLGYPPQRIQRIANLITRQPDVGVTSPLADGGSQAAAAVDGIAVGTRHPSTLTQLRILNEADAASIDSAGSHLADGGLRNQLQQHSETVAKKVTKLNAHSLPILTTEVPGRFGIFSMNKPYSLLAHVSEHMPTSFLKQLPVVESPRFSASTSLITDKSRILTDNEQHMVAIVEGPTENISQAHRKSIGTGYSVNWKQHVDLVKKWAESSEASGIATEINIKLQQLGFGNGKPLSALAEARERLAQFDNATELMASQDAKAIEAHKVIISSLTESSKGKPLSETNEVKINNPNVSALGILRRGRSVSLEGLDPQNFRTILGDTPIPAWLDLNASKNSVVIPRSTWQDARRLNLPIVVLDP